MNLAFICASPEISSAVTQDLAANGSSFVFINNYSSDSIVSVEINSLEFKSLVKNPDVESIIPVGVKHLVLQDAIKNISANSSWLLQQNSLNLSGIHQTVCVIDTGVNASHPDLSSKIVAQHCYCSANIYRDFNCCPNGLAEDSNAEDEDGHGTHVSGIVAASGFINGVAKGANLAVVRVFDNQTEAEAYDNDILDAMQWCIDNSGSYNISVITMSLGGNYNYSNYCDSNDSFESNSLYAAKINSAFLKNISVTIASGNSANYTHISSPACVQNATPVSSSTKSDTISGFSNRNWMVKLFAPGGDGTLGGAINSTCISGDDYYVAGYCRKQGTSMATPMVAGAIAILNEYLNLTNQKKTPSDIENILWQTGKNIVDSQNASQNFSRINIYSALMNLDNQAPLISLVSPANDSIDENQSQTFICNASDWQLYNLSFYLWNSTNDLVYNETKSLSGTFNESSFSVNNLDGSYKWACESYDVQGNRNISANNSLTIAFITTTLNFPQNNTSQTSAEFEFNCSFSTSLKYNLVNSTFYLWNSTNDLIYSETKNISGASNSSFFSYNLSNRDSYFWNCQSFNNNTNSSWASKNYSLTYASQTITHSSGGGGGGSSLPATISLDNASYSLGYTKSLYRGSSIKFSLENQNHTLSVNNVSSNFVNITLSSEPINFALLVGQEKKINLTNSEYYDLIVKLNSITYGQANITLEKINEPIVKTSLNSSSLYNVSNGSPKITFEAKNKNNYIGVLTIVIILFLIVILKFKKRKDKRYKKYR